MDEKVEEKSVDLPAVKGGIKLRAGHPVVLVVTGTTPSGGAAGAESAPGGEDAKADPAKD